jgi:hypothetical protein
VGAVGDERSQLRDGQRLTIAGTSGRADSHGAFSLPSPVLTVLLPAGVFSR